ncbi:MAG: CooT family nickel-binding protein [Eubacteriales bacterium]|nr:CooT family nickel-binding protein [Eubacteriales bacterium]
MCLSTIYADALPEPVGTNICRIHVENGCIVAVDIMGREIRLEGVIEEVDLLENIVRVRQIAC